MEQSREVYETATNQLGSFLELVSNRLTLNKTGLDTPPPAPLSVLSERQRSGAQGHVSNVSSPSHGSRGGSGVRKRSESENNRRKSSTGHAGRPGSRPGSRYLLEDPSLSPSISCASSSLSECDRSSGVGSSSGPRRTSELIKYSRERKSDLSEIGQGGHQGDEGVCDISILSSCTCPEEEEIHDKIDREPRKSSKTRNTLRRITSFMRKDKKMSLVETSGPASLKYSRYCHLPALPVTIQHNVHCYMNNFYPVPIITIISASTSRIRRHPSTSSDSGEFGL